MENKITHEWIEEQRALCEAATPGPWNASDYASVLAFTDAEVCQRANDNDMAFMATARTALPAALDALEAAYSEIARLTAERDAAVKDLQGMSDAAGTCFGCAYSIDNHCRHPELGKLCGEYHKYTWRGLCAENAPTGAESEEEHAE